MGRNSISGTSGVYTLFLVEQDIAFASYTDDNTIYEAGASIDDLILS